MVIESAFKPKGTHIKNELIITDEIFDFEILERYVEFIAYYFYYSDDLGFIKVMINKKESDKIISFILDIFSEDYTIKELNVRNRLNFLYNEEKNNVELTVFESNKIDKIIILLEKEDNVKIINHLIETFY